MWGQWIGEFSGINTGTIILSIDKDCAARQRGSVAVSHDDPLKPSFHATIQLSLSNETIVGDLSQFSPFTANRNIDESEKIKSNIPKTGMLKGKIIIPDHGVFRGELQIDIGTTDEFILFESDLVSSEHSFPRFPNPEDMSWEEYKEAILKAKKVNPGLIFRGHEDNNYKLKTSFHRCGRSNLNRYIQEDFPTLARYISYLTGDSYRLGSEYAYSDLLSLAQHHGYPTPFLDWTESPYVAAFFAFYKASKEEYDQSKKTRIYVFDSSKWHTRHMKSDFLLEPRPTISVHNFESRSNKRSMAQQSVVTFSNIWSMEWFIHQHENKHSEKYLRKIDIALSERHTVMKELEYMGITAASMFPGLDGTCMALKEKYF